MPSATSVRQPPPLSAISVDPFDLDIIVVESSELGSAVPASAGGCGATCSSGSCASSGA
ncbi:FDLD family class I lanthipeptide [Streptomyces smyrnaeus]|uniref:FDLD family class I lanthipeptide n=1 Tax=Streptomyces smyrnaeus TaxID=1387713 RepID=UPI00340196A9